MKMIIIILLAASPAYSNIIKQIHSAGLSFNSLRSDSELQNSDKNNVMTFRPNVSNGYGLSLETEYLSLAYIFSGSEAEFEDHEKTTFRDFRFNFHYYHFDFRLMYQNYHGAMVKEAGREEFYSNYSVNAKNIRTLYYRNKELLNYLSDGVTLTNKIIANEKFHFLHGWILGLNIDSRKIGLPENLAPEHQALVDEEIPKYNGSFYSLFAGPIGGYDWMMFWSSMFVRIKLAIGSVYQGSGDSSGQSEVLFKVGGAFNKRHLLTIGSDIYSISFKDSDQRIDNLNYHTAITYTYAFDKD